MNSLAIKVILLITLLSATTQAAGGFNADTYADKSVLAEGRWAKVSVRQTGLHMISNSDLRAMGFSNPDKVKIYGYGGARIPDHFTRDNYIDDLPLVRSSVTPRGIVFFAVGVETRVNLKNSDYFYHTLNPYSTAGYYFITENDSPAPEIPEEGLAPGADLTTTFIDGVRHEVDLTSPAESGHLLLGEDFRLTRSRNFSFQLPGRVEGTDVWMQAKLFAKTNDSPAIFKFTANGTPLEERSDDQIKPTTEYGNETAVQKTFTLESNSLSLGIECSYRGSVSVIALDHISVCYHRSISLPPSKTLVFTTSGSSPFVAGGNADTKVWDVTDPGNVIAMKTTPVSGGVAWTSEYFGNRTYAVWDASATFLTPGREGAVANQNLHGRSTPDMIILSHPSLISQSERIATMHRNEATPLDVLVVTPGAVYNEFGSGTPDINAIRRMLKMFYDRGTSDDGQHSLKYFLLMGGVTFDHRRLTEGISRSNGTYLPTWQTDTSNSENTSYSSDDFYAFLDDGSGLQTDRDQLRIAVGRIPARNASSAKVFTDRLLSYTSRPVSGEWRSRVVLMADDEDKAEHLEQTEDLEKRMRTNMQGENLTYSKVYLDSDPKLGGITVNARAKLHGLLNSGVIWWNYIGHASLRELSGEGVMTLKDVTSLYLRHPAFFYGATCSFLHWDGTELSGLEMLTMADSGGLIGGISAVRPVYITRNGILSNAMGEELFARDDAGRIRPVAEAFRRAKNKVTDTNRLRYVFLGDPAMRLAIPDNMVTLATVADKPATDDPDSEPAIIPALSPTTLKGSVTDVYGNVLTDFNGHLNFTIFDAERSFTTIGRNDKGGIDDEAIKNYDEQGDRIYAGRAKVTAGQWETSVLLPSEIADNFRPATMLMFAENDEATMAAGGVSRSFYAYGLSDDFTDDKAPVIEQLILNHESFENGGTVNATPMLIARIKDDNGFNLSSSGIGHMMSVRIDETTNLTDVSDSFTPDADGTPAGSIRYRLPELSPGNHTAMLKVWDVAGNSASATVDFFVDPNEAPKIFSLYSDANPALTEANFYIIHNRPDAMLTVKVEVFDINGAFVWSAATSGRADMYASSPVNWNLTDRNNNRVSHGIYVYRATVSEADSGITSTQTKRIAVSPQ